MIHDCIFYTIYRCEFFHDYVVLEGILQQCGDVSSFTCNHGGGRYCGRWKAKKYGPVEVTC